MMRNDKCNRGPKICAIGGGTGLSTMLRGLKKYTKNITAIVTVGDDGGGSGALREDLGILPPGDIRNCILALANTEPIMKELLQYRFKEGNLQGQSFGNLFLAAMNGICNNNFMEAVKAMSDVLAVTGKVLPVTLDNMRLSATLSNGMVVNGESRIPQVVEEYNTKIEEIRIEPANAKALREAVEAIYDADIIVLGPGSLYTSVIPNLLVEGIRNALKETTAMRVYVANLMTQHGESDGYTVSDHLKAVIKHADGTVIDYVLANSGNISDSFKKKYLGEDAEIVDIDEEEIAKLNIKVVKDDFVKIKNNEYVRHSATKLAKTIIKIYNDK